MITFDDFFLKQKFLIQWTITFVKYPYFSMQLKLDTVLRSVIISAKLYGPFTSAQCSPPKFQKSQRELQCHSIFLQAHQLKYHCKIFEAKSALPKVYQCRKTRGQRKVINTAAFQFQRKLLVFWGNVFFKTRSSQSVKMEKVYFVQNCRQW